MTDNIKELNEHYKATKAMQKNTDDQLEALGDEKMLNFGERAFKKSLEKASTRLAEDVEKIEQAIKVAQAAE